MASPLPNLSSAGVMNRLRFFGLSATVLSMFSTAGCTAVLGISSDPQTLSRECTTNQQCITSKGAPSICYKPGATPSPKDYTCQLVLNDDCKEILGADNLKNDDVMFFGALFAINGTNASVGKAEDASLHMAFNDFQTVGSLPAFPGSNTPRTISMVVCDDSAANDVALRSITHMIDDLQIPATIGPTWSGPTINYLTAKAIPSGFLTIASGTTSPDFTNLDKKNLFYRTSESTSLEAPPIATLSKNIEQQLIAGDPTLANKVKVFVGYKGDSFGKGTHTALVPSLSVGGLAANDPNQKNYKEADYGNPAAPTQDPLKYDDTVNQIIAFQPNIVILLGTGEAQTSIMGAAEPKWPSGVRKPYWVYTHIQVVSSMVTAIQTADPSGDLAKRVLGVTYGTSTSDAYRTFRQNFAGTQDPTINPDTIDTNTTYDAFYTLIYAAIAAGNKQLTGANIAAGIANLVPAPSAIPINVGPGNITQALNALVNGGHVDLTGTSGPLDFNLQTGDVAQENQVWCIGAAAANQPAFPTFSSYFFDLSGAAKGNIASLSPGGPGGKCSVNFNKPTTP
jgi:ABC-type branched-subunit amino acid transport system substrate-binding protein